MAKKVYMYEQGSCRGHDFTNKSIMKLDSVLSIVEEGLKARKKGEDEIDEFIEERIEYNKDMTYSEGMALCILVRGSDVEEDSTRTINARVKKLKEGKPFYVFCEESTLGFASSKKEAREVCLCADGEEW